MLALATVPIAIAANGLRVAGTGLAAHLWGSEMAEGFFHAFSGWLVFALSFALLVGIQWVVSRMASLTWVPAAGLPALVREKL